MKLLALAVGWCALARVAGADAAVAEPDLPSVTYEGEHPVVLRHGDLTVTLDSEPGSQPETRVPTFRGTYQGRPIFDLRVEDGEDAQPLTAARVVRLDPKTPLPQVVMTVYTGGAHCCTVTKIATALSPDSWQIVDGQRLDGDRGYLFVDIDRDGVAEMVSLDQNFLYGFSPYASSYPPTRIARLSGTEIIDITRDPKYRKFLRRELADMEKDARKDRTLWHSNGFLAGWVAAKSLVGEVDDAWRRMLASYDRKSDWPMQECVSGQTLETCPKDKLRDIPFPQALRKVLAENGYPRPR